MQTNTVVNNDQCLIGWKTSSYREGAVLVRKSVENQSYLEKLEKFLESGVIDLQHIHYYFIKKIMALLLSE